MYNPPNKPPDRRSIRWKGYDYSKAGYYFVTLCTHNKLKIFGEIVNDSMILNSLGGTVESQWKMIPSRYSNIKLDAFVVMPNHFHGILIVGGPPESTSISRPTAKNLGAVIGAFKAGVTRHSGSHRGNDPIWQRDYWERVIRNEEELSAIRHYIELNPAQWIGDDFNTGDAQLARR